MRKIPFLAFLSVLTLFSLLTSCNGDKTPPVSERIAKVWTARAVDENSQTVYTRGGTANVRNYANYKLDLSAAPTVKYTAFDGNTFTGQYSVPSDDRLVLTNLTPAPTGTNGTIEFTINSISDTELKLTAKEISQKTGGTTNVYTLSNP
ncbi:hypothetical protein GCM10027341_26800 [Spirosoma knui]